MTDVVTAGWSPELQLAEQLAFDHVIEVVPVWFAVEIMPLSEFDAV